MPWTPSFLPFLLRQMDRYRDGPDALMDLAIELRQKPAIKEYREVREAALDAADPQKATEARSELAAAADTAAKALDSSRNELELTRYALVEILPSAMGVGVGLVVGTVAPEPPGGLVGGVVGSVVQRALRATQERLFGWALEGLSFRSARKLLGRAVKADRELADQMANQLRTIWETGPKAAD
jgi:hypothetical protein